MAPPESKQEWEDQIHRAEDYQPLKAIDKLGSASEWRAVNALSFRVILKKPTGNTVPQFLVPYFQNAKECVKTSVKMKTLCGILKEPWRDWSRPQLVEAGGIFGVFLSRLAEVRQVEAVIEPPRQYDLHSRAQESTD